MTKPSVLAFAFGLSLAASAFSQTPGLGSPTPFVAYSGGVLPESAPGSSTGWTAEDAFPNLQFVDPVWLVQIPGTSSLPADQGELLLVGKDGQIWRFDNDPAVLQGDVVSVLDWRAEVQTGEDMGFYQIIFHPNFGQSGQIGENYVYACYNHNPGLSGADINHSYWRVSRFEWDFGTGTIDNTSEFVFINQYDPQQWHNGGAMYFDNEGFLNITCGDGEFDYWHQDQNGPIDGGFFGGVFRIDVDYVEELAADPGYSASHAIRRQPLDIPTGGFALPAGWPASSTQGYGIPFTNPFRDATDPATVPTATVLEEFVTHGLRSPHTAHYDPVEDEVWVGDVGGGAREELSRIVLGDNGQWPIREGFLGGGEPAGAIGAWVDPLHDYVRSEGTCIIGGMRYRGAKWSGPLGTNRIIFGDHGAGKVWTAILDGAGNLEGVELLLDGFKSGGKTGLANFCTDDAGEIYLMELNGTNIDGGKIKRLETAGISLNPPQWLSATGLFSDVSTLTPATGVIPYDVANPLWSDAAHKFRWIAVPNDGTHDTPAEEIVFDEEYSWVFPPGTVFIKHFELDTDLDPSVEAIRRLETRLIVCTEGGGKYGVTYKWNAAGTDAELMGTDPGTNPDGLSELIPMTDNGLWASSQNWDFPSRAQCLQCHTTAAGQALGLKTTQLNCEQLYPSTGITANQILTLNSLGMFDQALTPTQLANFIESRAIDDPSAPLEHRVRSYLDSNCAHCHQPGSVVEYFDARLGTPLSTQGLINGPLQGHYATTFPGGVDGRYLKPGDVPLSVVHFRANHLGLGNAMPPLAKNLVDQPAVDLIEDYILSLTESEFETTAGPEARYVRLTSLIDGYGGPWASVGEFAVLDDAGSPITVGVTIDDFSTEEETGEGPDNGHAIHAIDGNPGTFWHTYWSGADPDPGPPHWIILDLGSVKNIGGYEYIPRQGLQNGRVQQYEVHYSIDGAAWTLLDTGFWPNDAVTKTYTGKVGQRKTRCEIAGPPGTLAGDVEVTIVFDKDVTDFAASDLTVAGGSVTSLRGSGYYYVATVSPSATTMTISVPEDAANTAEEGSRASNMLILGGLFDQWAAANSLGAVTYNQDTNDDGIVVLLEFLLNLDPNTQGAPIFNPAVPTPNGLPHISLVPEGGGEGRLTIQFPRDSAAVAEGYQYIGQFSNNLLEWTDVPVTSISTELGGGWQHAMIQDVETTDTQGRRYARLKVVAP